MSAFVVEDKTVNSIVLFIAKERGQLGYWKAQLKDAGFDLDTYDGQVALGKAMFALNVQAVTTRYKGGAEDFRTMNYKFQASLTTQYQALKSLKCWLYQCSEGDVPETELFKIMDKISNALAYNIASRTPQFEAANWG